ncbi:MAG TPA: hypothetical protein VIL97_02245, partial [Thermoanaerobaculia bacterium]
MKSQARAFAWLWIFGIALGWFEASVVVYLRAIYYPEGFQFPIVILPTRIAVVEITREVASFVLLAATAWLAGRRFHERFAAFLILFGVWDLVYYAGLKVALDWPPSLATWDILFLIPLPWSGPVWAPMLVSVALIACGSFLYLTPIPRRLTRLDWIVEIAAGLAIIASFLAEWRTVVEQRVPREFSEPLFFAGLVAGIV